MHFFRTFPKVVSAKGYWNDWLVFWGKMESIPPKKYSYIPKPIADRGVDPRVLGGLKIGPTAAARHPPPRPTELLKQLWAVFQQFGEILDICARPKKQSLRGQAWVVPRLGLAWAWAWPQKWTGSKGRDVNFQMRDDLGLEPGQKLKAHPTGICIF